MLEMTQQNLQKVISNVLERMFFIFIEPVSANECAGELTGTSFHHVHISFAGAQKKLELAFYFATSLGTQMAANFLGMEVSEVDTTQVRDVLKEMVNMVAGGLVNIGDPDGRIKLGIPNVAEVVRPGEEIIMNVGLTCYGSDDGYLFVHCFDG